MLFLQASFRIHYIIVKRSKVLHSFYIRARAPTQIRTWFQARDIIGKMASNCGEESGAPIVFGPILGKVQVFC